MKDSKRSRWLIVGTLLINAVGWSVQVNADGAVGPIAQSSLTLFEAAAVDSEKLAISRGGAELNLYDIKSDGLVSNNQASNLTTGSNWITEGSFAGAAGFSTVVQNSGNNVLIQNPTIINLQVQ